MISKKLDHVLDQKSLVLLNYPTTKQRTAYEKWTNEDSQVKCYVPTSLTNELQSQHEHMPIVRTMIPHL